MNNFPFRGYVRTDGKQPKERYKDVPDERLLTFQEAIANKSFAGVLTKDAILIDIDERKRAETILSIIEKQNVRCLVIDTERGMHFYFRNGRIDKRDSHLLLSCGIEADVKSGQKAAVGILQKDGKKRMRLRDVEANQEYDNLPVWLIPTVKLKGTPDLFQLHNGEGRNDSLSKLVFYCGAAGMKPEEIITAFHVLNENILADPLDENELMTILRPETLEKACRGDNSERKNDIETFQRFIKDELKMTIRYNQMLNCTEYFNKPPEFSTIQDETNQIPVKLADMFARFIHKHVSKTRCEELISFEADQNAYNPVCEYLSGIKWDGNDRFPIIFDALNVADDLSKCLVRKWFYQCVAMAFNPADDPEGAEGVLTLICPEGIGKSQFFKLITPDSRWFNSISSAICLNNKDDVINAVSAWICEIGEIDSTFARKDSAIKALITNSENRIRKPYAKEPVRIPRRTSFGASSNVNQLLTDESGKRRWWIIQLDRNIKRSLLEDLRRDGLNQLWAQCYDAYQNDQNCFRLNDAELASVISRTDQHTKPEEGMEEIFSAFDWDAPAEEWKFMTSTKIRSQSCALEKYTASKIGFLLKRLVQRDSRIATKSVHGANQYLFPPKNLDG